MSVFIENLLLQNWFVKELENLYDPITNEEIKPSSPLTKKTPLLFDNKSY